MGVMRELSIRWLAWWVAGMVSGVAVMALFRRLSRLRSLHRTRLATSVILLSRLTPIDTRRIFSGHPCPPWVVFPRQEKIDWLDQNVAKIWPFLGKEACGPLMTWLESTLELYNNDIFTSFKFRKFILGPTPPQFSGMQKVKSKHDEITLEFDFQWIFDPDIVLEVQTVQTVAGSVFPVQIKDVSFAGRFRLTFKPLADEFPCFQAFTYSIRDLKGLHFHVKGVPGVVYAQPGFLKMVKRFIKTAIKDALVWPMRQIYKIVPGDYRELELRVSGVLRVKVVEARKLLNMDTIGKSDPFTILYIRHIPSRIKRSKTINNDLNPIWNETFRFEVEDLPTQSLFIKVLDDDGVQEADDLGCAKYELKNLKPGELVDLWIPLHKDFDGNDSSHHKSRGEIHLELCYVCTNEDLLQPLASLTTPRSPLSRQLTAMERHFSAKNLTLSPPIKTLLSPRNLTGSAVFRGILSITVLRADDLMTKKPNKALNAYALLKLKKSSAILRTKVVPNTHKPEWNEVFNIVIEDALHDMLLLEVWNHKFLKKSLIGKRAVTVTCLLQHNNNDMEVELQEENAGKVILHLEWRCPAATDPQFF